ncbi:hypothetical protein TorRG33x02_017400 [Trema orientale]|uniref:Uncharacterized protein n=1 Tax=Trema orientale TaxID=63057 RepID=A0A2P5FYA7_TREOI|nr:hypothetical protein TorRG33x02_017400 [Trema orientale]
MWSRLGLGGSTGAGHLSWVYWVLPHLGMQEDRGGSPEMEVREEKEFGLVEGIGKPRKRHHIARSNKEKVTNLDYY